MLPAASATKWHKYRPGAIRTYKKRPSIEKLGAI